MNDRLIFRNPELPAPIMLNEVPLKNDQVGFFPHFTTRFKHGFWWKNVPNIAYIQEPGFYSDRRMEREMAMNRVNYRAGQFLKIMEAGPLEKAVVLGPSPGDTRIIDLNDDVLKHPKTTEHISTYLEGGAIFTTKPDQPVYTIGNDCAWSFFYCKRPTKAPVGGIAHSGRVEVEQYYPKTVINHLVNNYGCDPKNIEIGIAPSLEPEHHTIQIDTLEKNLKYPWRWTPHYMQQLQENGPLHLDVRSWVADQYIESGVPAENIVLSTVGTYESQSQGFGFSHRFATVHGLPEGRIAVGFQLSNPSTFGDLAQRFRVLKSKITR